MLPRVARRKRDSVSIEAQSISPRAAAPLGTDQGPLRDGPFDALCPGNLRVLLFTLLAYIAYSDQQRTSRVAPTCACGWLKEEGDNPDILSIPTSPIEHGNIPEGAAFCKVAIDVNLMPDLL